MCYNCEWKLYRKLPFSRAAQTSVALFLVKMIDLAFCITELNIGGAERALCELAIRVDKSRFRVKVYSLQSRPVDDTVSCVPMLEAAGIPVRFLDMKGPTSFLPGFFRLRKLLKEQKPDIFLSFLFHANFLGRLAAQSIGIRHIVSGIRVAEHEKRWHLILDRWTSRYVEKYVCVSDSVADFTHAEAKIPSEKIVVIPNGIEMPDSVENSERQNRIIFIGRLAYQKGLDWFLETVPTWLPKLPDWELWIVGDGEERKTLTDRLLAPAFDAVRDRTTLTGWRVDAPSLLAKSRMLVLPSRWEGMPNVILQAMAVGIPVVVTAVEGVLELLGPEAGEQTCVFGQSEVFSEKILAIAKNELLAERLGRMNRLRVNENFRLETVVETYERFFENMIERRFS